MIGDEIKALRKMRGLTQTQVAEALNVSQSTVTSWESGTRQPVSDFLPTIADYFGVTVDELLGHPTPHTRDLGDEALAIRERLRRDPSYRMLFDAADNASPDHLRAAAAMLKALEPEDDEEN